MHPGRARVGQDHFVGLLDIANVRPRVSAHKEGQIYLEQERGPGGRRQEEALGPFRPATSRMCRKARDIMSGYRAGLFPRQLTRTSAPSAARATAAASVASPCRTSRLAAPATSEGVRASTRTRCPAARSSGTRRRPVPPVAPYTATVSAPPAISAPHG